MAPLVVIVGETASGKSAIALELAERFNGEIICADSWTVRREVTIGTAKPSPEEQKRVRHHLLDVVGPDEDFTAAVFKRLANEAIKDMAQRGKLAIMVGGTGLYIDGVLFDYGFLPAGDRQERQAWNEMSVEELQAEIKARGFGLEGIDVRNKRRLIRVLETNGAKPQKATMRPHTLVLGISIPKETLREKIEQRVDTMIDEGLEQEARQLAKQYGWDCEALKGIGYKEWKGYFEGTQTLDETRASIIKATHDLAKRQRTWFKRNSSIQWLNDPKEFVAIVTTFLNKKQ